MTIYLIVNGVEQSLPPIINHEGWGMSNVALFTSEGSQQIGGTIHGHRLRPRVGSFVFQQPTSTLGTMYDLRAELLELFNPLNSIEVVFDLGYGVRKIAVHYLSDMSMPWVGKSYAAQRVALSLYCPDPLFYDPDANSAVFELGGTGGTPVPTPVDTPVAGASIGEIRNVQTEGNYHTFPSVMRITGPITNPVVHNLTLDKKLDFTGTTIPVDDYYDIILLYGLKAVVNKAGTKKVQDLTDDSNIDSWMFAAHPLAPNGNNSIQVIGSSVTSSTKIEIGWSDKYLGV